MNRRNFLGMIGGVAATAAVRTFPFRVFSFPTEINIRKPMIFDKSIIFDYDTTRFYYDAELIKNLKSTDMFMKIGERRVVPISFGLNRPFFIYSS